MSNFQNELRNDDGYENVVIIAVGQSNISSFNSSYCENSDLPLVEDTYPTLPIREQFSSLEIGGDDGLHKQLVILNYDGTLLSNLILSSGVTTNVKNYIRDILSENYEQVLIGDLNNDSTINVQDIILIINIILYGGNNPAGDMNGDGTINVLDVVQVVNIILNS